MTALCVEPRRWFAAAILLAAVATQALAAETIPVAIDEARIIKLPDRAATVVIGNPLIADISIQAGNVAVITAKSYGSTNVIAMDVRGAVLMEKSLSVSGPKDVVTVYRGVTRETYSCTPYCSARITPGDAEEYFTKIINEVATRNTQSMGAGSTPH
jgi:Flp pilus assembly secretin CpaC